MASAANEIDCEIGAVRFTTARFEESLAALLRWTAANDRAALRIGYINPHVFNAAYRHEDVRRFLAEADIVCVDGIGLVLGARLFLGLSLPRVISTRLFESLLDRTDVTARAVLIGTTQSEVQAAADAMNARSAGLEITATMHGFHPIDFYVRSFESMTDVDAVLVGAGTPKSEQILLAAGRSLPRALCFHIGGGTLRIYAGTKRRAPRWLSNAGLEWVHRMAFEPALRSRYLGGGLEFVANLRRAATMRRRERRLA